MAQSILVITHGETSLTLRNQWNFSSANGQLNLKNLVNWMQGVEVGARHNISVDSRMGQTAATNTITSTGAATATETFVLNGVTFTAVGGSPEVPGANEFIVSATPATQATNIAAAINNSVTAGVADVTASATDGVVTLTSDIPGTIGNAMTLSETLTNVTIGGANFTGGASDLDVIWSA